MIAPHPFPFLSNGGDSCLCVKGFCKDSGINYLLEACLMILMHTFNVD